MPHKGPYNTKEKDRMADFERRNADLSWAERAGSRSGFSAADSQLIDPVSLDPSGSLDSNSFGIRCCCSNSKGWMVMIRRYRSHWIMCKMHSAVKHRWGANPTAYRMNETWEQKWVSFPLTMTLMAGRQEKNWQCPCYFCQSLPEWIFNQSRDSSRVDWKSSLVHDRAKGGIHNTETVWQNSQTVTAELYLFSEKAKFLVRIIHRRCKAGFWIWMLFCPSVIWHSTFKPQVWQQF